VGFSVGISSAQAFEGNKTIRLHPADGEPLTIGQVSFDASASGKYVLSYDDTLFTDHFLSMRPFKCLEGDDKLWCRVPYPYENAQTVSEEDLTDLEYDLMFVWKNQGEYGIDLWNGVYYVLSPDGEKLVGTMHEIDMNVLASPPEDGNLRPVTAGDLEEADIDSHWLPMLTIE
jgi:hypothetical protein